MARKYMFTCDRCAAAVVSDTERLPDGWLIVCAVGERLEPGPSLRTYQLDLCSAACALDALARAPELATVARTRAAALGAGGGVGGVLLIEGASLPAADGEP